MSSQIVYDLKLSICVITYNHINFIDTTLKSILEQNIDFPHEIIIADDCSTDGTKEILIDYAKRHNEIKLILQNKNIGGAKNFTQLITSAKGQYVAYLDGDDLMLPGKIKFQVDFLDKNSDCNIIAHNMRVIDFDRGVYQGNFSKIKDGKYNVGHLSSIGTFFANSSKMYRNSSNEGYPYYDKFKYIGDLAWHIYQTKENLIGYSSDNYGIYRKHIKSASFQNNIKERIENSYEENIMSIKLVSKYGGSEKDVNKGIIRLTYSLALQYLKLKDYKSYRKYMRKSSEKGGFYSLKHFLLSKTLFLPDSLLKLI